MSRLTLSPRYEAARRLPIAFALAEHGVEPDDRGRYLCRYHPDDRPGGRPSADVWETADGEVLACWSCGHRSDAVEVLQEVMGATLSDALEEAERLLAVAPRPRRRAEKRALDPAKLEREYEVSTTRVRYPRDVDPLIAFVEAQRNPLPPVDYLREGWGWRGDFRGNVVIPWRGPDGTLTGLRYRVAPTWRKDGRRGSRFELYGAERARSSTNEVWLCEGESDTVWAAYHLEPDVTVLGIGSASQRPTPTLLEPLRNRVVVLAFDPDGPGERAAGRWFDALVRKAAKVRRLPLEADLRATAANPRTLRASLWKDSSIPLQGREAETAFESRNGYLPVGHPREVSGGSEVHRAD